MLFLVTTGENIAFISAVDIMQAERYVREWLNDIGSIEEVITSSTDASVAFWINGEQLVIRPLPPLCDLQSLTKPPFNFGVTRSGGIKQARYHDEYLETL